jgi:hypothetical protein
MRLFFFGVASGLVAVSQLLASVAFAEKANAIKTEIVDTVGEPAVEVTFTLPPISMVQTKDGQVQIKVEDLNYLAEPGAPDLPTAGVLIAVPTGFQAKLVTLKEQKRNLLSTSAVTPLEQKWRCSNLMTHNLSDTVVSSIYKSKSIYPTSAIRLENIGKMQDVSLVRLAFYPVRIDFAHDSTEVMDSATVRVEFVPTQTASVVTTLPAALTQLIQASTVNGVASRYIKAATAPERMLVVTADQYADSIADLIAWKRSRGMLVDVATWSQVGSSRDNLATFVKNYYDTQAPRLTYLLLVGNGSHIPPFRRSTSSGSAASDYPFSLLSGNDIVPDIIVGRLLADNETNLRTQITKWLNHERRPEEGEAGDWYSLGTTIASSEGSRPSDVDYAEMIQASLLGNTYTAVDKFYEGRGTATSTNIKNALNSGRSWLTYIGHGSGTSWGSTNTTFSTNTIRSLSNERLPIIVDVACLNGSFVDINTSFGEAWVTQESGGKGAGALGYYGASVSTSWDPPAIMATGIAKRHYENSISALGASLLAGQLYLIERSGTGSGVVDNLEWFNLLGDPSLTMRTANPKNYDMTYEIGESESGLSITVHTANPDQTPATGVTVAVTAAADGSLIALGITGVEGQVTLPISASEQLPGARLTASGYNLATKESVLP